MYKASKILFLIGGIIAVLSVFAYLLCFIASFVCGGLCLAIVEGQEVDARIVEIFNKACTESGMTMQQMAAGFITMGVVFTVLFVFSIASAVLSFIDKGKSNPGLGLLIPSVVIHLCAGNVVSLVGGTLGIVYWSIWGRKLS